MVGIALFRLESFMTVWRTPSPSAVSFNSMGQQLVAYFQLFENLIHFLLKLH